MKRLVFIGGVSMALATAVACATSEESTEPNAEPAPESSIPDASVRDVTIGSDASVEPRGPLCSSDGWCETMLPAPDLVVRDIWPLPDRAFAIAESYNSGIKVLEWTSTDSTWRYIDDNSQNEVLFADAAIKIWSPNADEVYYAAWPGIIFHGRRPVAPATAWSWRSWRLEDNNPSKLDVGNKFFQRMVLGVWGTGSDDVYAWYSNTIFRRKSGDGGAAEWVPEHIANDVETPDEQIFITGAAANDANEVWFIGGRARYGKELPCNLIVRKSPGEYRRIADGVYPTTGSSCTARAGIPLVLDGREWPTQLQSLDGHRFLFLQVEREHNKIVQIAPDGDGYSVNSASVPSTMATPPYWSSVWRESEDRLWLAGAYQTSGIVVQGTRVWEDGGEYRYASLALNGAPSRPVNQIRGTSNTNLWAVGDRYAIHKTTP